MGNDSKVQGMTPARYAQSMADLIGSSLGMSGSVADGTLSVPDPGLEIVIVDRVYPDSMMVQFTYRETTDKETKTSTGTAMILSSMISDDHKLLWIPSGTSHEEPKTKRKYIVPFQKTLTGLVANVNASGKDGKIFLGYIRMQGEGIVIPDTEMILPLEELITREPSGNIVISNSNSMITISKDRIDIIGDVYINGVKQ